jgi:predicted outer membrane repeat protein
MQIWKKVFRFLFFVVLGLVALGLISYLINRTPIAVAPITLEWHTGIEKPVILFVHGLNGDAYETWNKADHSFMQMMARDPDFADYAVASVQYRSNIFWRRPSIPQLATKFGECLKEKFSKNSHIVIIAHSLGGIIARQGLAQSDLPKRQHQFVTLITLASPFEGSELSNFTSGLSACGITSSQLSALGVNSDLLQLCESNWNSLLQSCGPQIRQFAASEGKAVAGIVPVVSRSSATKGIAPEFTFHSEGDTHLTIARPSSLKTPIGKRVREWTLAALKLREYGTGQHLITQDLEIPAGGLLVLRPGANLSFRKGARLLIKGQIKAEGTEQDPIIFDFDSSSDAEAGILLRGVDTAESQFLYCNFRYGNGIGVTKPSPARQATVAGKALYAEKETVVTSVGNRAGGAVLLIGATKITFTNCTFADNQAYQGGAMALFGTDRVQINHCTFSRNTSSFGGGAIFAQASEVYITGKCEFETNTSGHLPTAINDSASNVDACGGALYLGFGMRCDVRDATFRNNETSNAGGAIYIYNTHPPSWQMTTANQMFKLIFRGNRSYRREGGAVRIDGETKTSLVDPVFEDNYSGFDSRAPGPALKDESRLPTQVQVINPTFRRNGLSYSERSRTREAANTADAGRPSLPAPMQNPKSYRTADQRLIDTIVIHSISATRWNDPEFRKRFADQLHVFESLPAIQAAVVNPSEARFDWRLCKEILELTDQSTHYLIDRTGAIRQLVADKDIAFHSGKSVMPKGDDRQSVDDFSLGIQIIGADSQTDVVPKVGDAPGFTRAQYEALDDLLLELSRKHRISSKNIVAHSAVSGERALSLNLLSSAEMSTDPGEQFDWTGTLQRLEINLAKEVKVVLQPTPVETNVSRPTLPDS